MVRMATGGFCLSGIAEIYRFLIFLIFLFIFCVLRISGQGFGLDGSFVPDGGLISGPKRWPHRRFQPAGRAGNPVARRAGRTLAQMGEKRLRDKVSLAWIVKEEAGKNLGGVPVLKFWRRER